MKYLIIGLLTYSCFGQVPVPDHLISALIIKESNGNNQAVGDSGKALGCLQIWDVVVQDVNRIHGTKYTHRQMLDRESAIDVCRKYLAFWGAQYEKKTGNQADPEVLARIWNGGPQGYRKEATRNYGRSVMATMKEQNP